MDTRGGSASRSSFVWPTWWMAPQWRSLSLSAASIPGSWTLMDSPHNEGRHQQPVGGCSYGRYPPLFSSRIVFTPARTREKKGDNISFFSFAHLFYLFFSLSFYRRCIGHCSDVRVFSGAFRSNISFFFLHFYNMFFLSLLHSLLTWKKIPSYCIKPDKNS